MKNFYDWVTGKSSSKVPVQVPVPPKDSLFSIRKDIDSSAIRLMPLNGLPKEQTVYDCFCFLVYCPTHSKIAVSRTTSSDNNSVAVWLPFIWVSAQASWAKSALDGVAIILSNGEANRLNQIKSTQPFTTNVLEVFRLQSTETQKFVQRIICLAQLESTDSTFRCCQSTTRVDWIDCADAQADRVADVWGPEVSTFSKLVDKSDYQEVVEYGLDDVFKYVKRDPARNQEEELLNSLDINDKHIEWLFIAFVEHCYPSFHMSRTSFKQFINRYSTEKSDTKLTNLFNASNFGYTQYIGFHELLLGLASIEPKALNGISRLKFMFKYFDSDCDGYLNNSEFKQMVIAIKATDSESEISKQFKDGLNLMSDSPKGISFESFSASVASVKFRGTNGLCRSNKSLFYLIFRATNKMMANKQQTTAATAETTRALKEVVSKRQYKGVCLNCQSVRYELCSHSVLLDRNGQCSDPQRLTEIEHILQSQSQSKEKSSKQKQLVSNPKHSIEIVFDPKSLANYFISQIRLFNPKKGTLSKPNGIFSDSNQRHEFVNSLRQLCRAIEEILSGEERCLRISSPAIVIGDIHGNLEDLLSLEKNLFRSAPILSAKYVFLGDYVDRGKWGTECAIFLLSLKLLAPNNVFLLRGNHEIRIIQKQYSFLKECNRKYGSNYGQQVFEYLNRTFDRLALAAIIDDSVFCSHGGIPTTANTIDAINQIPKELPDPYEQSPLAWQMVWNDPITNEHFIQTCNLLKIRKDQSGGFAPNQKRGTAFYFNEEAALKFLATNHLTHIIRAHEVPRTGYKFHFDKLCLTVFSCSHYCGQDNVAAVVLVADHTIRIISLDTTNNAPATDNS